MSRGCWEEQWAAKLLWSLYSAIYFIDSHKNVLYDYIHLRSMEDRVFDLSNIVGFDWDKGNKQKNWGKHRVDYIECEEVFFNRPLITGKDKKHSGDETRYFALGRTDAGRPLFLAFTIRNNKIRVISAREQADKEWRKYERQI